MPRTRQFDRDAALHEAMKLFWQKGYEATSVQDLVERMGIRRGSLYGTFGSKRSLFLAAIDRYLEVFVAERFAALDGPGSPKDAIRGFFQDVLSFSIGEGRAVGCLLTNSAVELAPHDRELGDTIAASFRRMEKAFYGALVRAREQGEIAAEKDPRALARFLVNSLNGLRVMSKTNPRRFQMRQVVEVTLSALD